MHAHKNLDDAVVNNKAVNSDISFEEIFGEYFAGTVIAIVVDLGPAWYAWGAATKWRDDSQPTIMVCLGVIIVATAIIFGHRRIRIARIKNRGAKWREYFNGLIAMTRALTESERQELYAAMYVIGLEVHQSKLNGQSIRRAYNDQADADWWFLWSKNM